jgi:hypothetical protein
MQLVVDPVVANDGGNAEERWQEEQDESGPLDAAKGAIALPGRRRL